MTLTQLARTGLTSLRLGYDLGTAGRRPYISRFVLCTASFLAYLRPGYGLGSRVFHQKYDRESQSVGQKCQIITKKLVKNAQH